MAWKPHEATDPSCQQGALRAGGVVFTFGGLFIRTEMGTVVRVTSSVTGGRYLYILDGHMLTFLRLQHPTEDLFLQQANAARHRSRIISKWLDEHSTEVNLFPWPARSFDLDPIDHIRCAIERDIRASNPIHDIAVNSGRLFRDCGWVCLPNASSILSSSCLCYPGERWCCTIVD